MKPSVIAKSMASLTVMRMVMVDRWEAVVCSCSSLAAGGRGDKEDNSEMATTTNRAAETMQ